MKRFFAMVIAGAMLISLTACGKTTDKKDASYDPSSNTSSDKTSETTQLTFGFEDEPNNTVSDFPLADEDQAQKVFKCSNNNIFGLEKLALFGDRIVAVFDKDINDKAGGFLNEGTDAIIYSCLSFNNASGTEPYYSILEESGKYVVEAYCHLDQSDLIDPQRETKITRLFIKSEHDVMNIYIYADDLELVLYTESKDKHEQYFNGSENSWDSVRSEYYKPPEDTGIPISYDLMLKDYWSDDRTVEYDGVKYTVESFGRYLYVSVENTTDEIKTIGGTRYLQRVKDDMLIDLGRDTREMTYGDTKVKDMTPVTIYEMHYVDEDTPWQRNVEPTYELKENETAEIMPHQQYYAEILVLDFDTYDGGNYRMTFGDAQLDFELRWEMIW